jgi:hypothetical protein
MTAYYQHDIRIISEIEGYFNEISDQTDDFGKPFYSNTYGFKVLVNGQVFDIQASVEPDIEVEFIGGCHELVIDDGLQVSVSDLVGYEEVCEAVLACYRSRVQLLACKTKRLAA